MSDITPHRVSLYGPGVMATTNSTASRRVCLQEAPRLAREMKEDEKLRWCTWFVEPATYHPVDKTEIF